MGPNARKPAPGIGVRGGKPAEILRLDAADATVIQTNDGKRSEWVDYLQVNDECDLVPLDPMAALRAFNGILVGVTRQGRPHGAEPLLSGEWDLSLLLTRLTQS